MQTQTVNAAIQLDTSDDFNQSKLPIDRESIRSRRLLRLIELVEVLRVPDNDRTIWQMLLDAGANPDFILLRDCDDESRLARRPALQVNVNTSKLHGFLVITHNSDDTGYKILLQVRIPRHLDTQPTIIWTLIPRSLGQAVGAQRRRFALLV
ncbi:MAG: hypothetical protein ACOKSU_21370 [Pseudomonas sp.]|uniref:hypothetical protein n=1 Tax=Pseudomonas TaxID=286 RepID=UPI0003C07A6F|nr:hypothetical protein [Pseudomonas sp. VLB120]AGZ38211.1 hypothetical protein PVLB_27372 [Pseudomonas sp. VLB120]